MQLRRDLTLASYPWPTWLCPLHANSHRHHVELQRLLILFPAFLCWHLPQGTTAKLQGNWSCPRWA